MTGLSNSTEPCLYLIGGNDGNGEDMGLLVQAYTVNEARKYWVKYYELEPTDIGPSITHIHLINKRAAYSGPLVWDGPDCKEVA